ncbi:L-threonylcarbamoyladenylate synthase [Janibacter sp. G56]|uniref:L-threonylcarbamoyladenylate synthase n=1 Tax=Janibacter sp. G56 TaxID=3418717 RepID=UPI003D039163
MSSVVDCTTPEAREQGLPQVVDAVRAGHVVVMPTDTVYGVGCDAFNAAAVAKVLDAKGRGREMPPPVLVPTPRTVDGLATDVPRYARDLIRAFWPGPLTLVLRAQPSLVWDLGETAGTVALRMPDDDVALTILAEIGPMAVTSANRTGEPAATSVLDAATQLGSAVTVYADGGPREGRTASTIIDCTGDSPVVLREGALSEADLAPVLEASLGLAVADADGPTAGDDQTEADSSVAQDNPDLAPIEHPDVPDDGWVDDPSAPAPGEDPLSYDAPSEAPAPDGPDAPDATAPSRDPAAPTHPEDTHEQ